MTSNTIPTPHGAGRIGVTFGETDAELAPVPFRAKTDRLQPLGFALRPLSTVLETHHGVASKSLDPATGTWGTPLSRNYQTIDLESWARAWLAGMDLLCAERHARPATAIAPAAMQRVLAARTQLAGAIADGLCPILVTADGSMGSPAWQAAREVMYRRLLDQLVSAYSLSAIVQFSAASVGSTSTTPLSLSLDVAQVPQYRAVMLAPLVVDNDVLNGRGFVRALHTFPPAVFPAQTGAALVPVPLRACPDRPNMEAQTATHANRRVDDALHWNYSVTFAHRATAQDQILLDIEFNPRPLPMNAHDSGPNTLFQALAQYIVISDTLWKLLGSLPVTGPKPPLVGAALETYAELAEEVAAAWSSRWGTDQAQAVDTKRESAGHQRYLATLDVDTVDGVDVDATLTLHRLDANASENWPEIVAIDAKGVETALKPLDPVDMTREYRFPSGDDNQAIAAFAQRAFRFTIPSLHVAHAHSARATVSLVRNAQLLGIGGAQTHAEFVYRTEPAHFAEPLVPHIVIDTRLDIGSWSQDAKTNPLMVLFDKLFDHAPAHCDVAIAVRYGSKVGSDQSPIEALVPVALYPRGAYDPEVTLRIIDAAQAWIERMQPSAKGGFWDFDIKIYASVDVPLERPLVELAHAVSSIA